MSRKRLFQEYPNVNYDKVWTNEKFYRTILVPLCVKPLYFWPDGENCRVSDFNVSNATGISSKLMVCESAKMLPLYWKLWQMQKSSWWWNNGDKLYDFKLQY